MSEYPETAIVRNNILTSYIENITEFLKTIYPEENSKNIETFVHEYVKNTCNKLIDNLNKLYNSDYEYDLDIPRFGENRLWPTLQILRCIDPNMPDRHVHLAGNIVPQNNAPLLDVINEYNNKIITPFGTFYETADKQESFLKGMIDIKMKQRKVEKKAMLKAKKDGDKNAEIFHNNNQATIKIITNSTYGCLGSQGNFMSSVSGLNSVTSTARFFTMNAYGHCERLLNGNFYFKNEDAVINFIINCKQKMPDRDKVSNIIKEYNLYQPTWEDVYKFLIENLHKYTFSHEHPNLKKMLINCLDSELSFIFYMSNLKNLFIRNENIFKKWFNDVIESRHMEANSVYSLDDLDSLDGDLITVLNVLCGSFIPKNAKGNTISIFDCKNSYPDIALRIVTIGKYVEQKISDIWNVFELFTNHHVSISDVISHKFMFRDTVVISDTDSIIFTTKDWIKWYTGELRLNEMGFYVNTIVVFFLSKATAFMLKHLSYDVGATGKNLTTMNMKNEFLFTIQMMTSLKKHYISSLAIQEGVTYGTPRVAISGVSLRGSNFVKSVLNYVEWFVKTILDDINDKGKVCVSDKIYYILCFERMIYDSLHKGSPEFLNVEPIKMAEEYKDADKSVYFNYLFWEGVFAEKYGSIQIPTKCYMLPLTNLRSTDYEEFLKTNYSDIYIKYLDFLTKHPEKEITRIPINPLTDNIPDELKPITNYRSIVYSNGRPLYLIMKSFGISLGTMQKQTNIFSDVYGFVSEEDGKKARAHI